ncbi:MAG TPA: carboxymuconolactone decarboxylase family protein [Salinimicrobium sp.]|nr:carboxymuconolactone decarboxylase family protein [Salinimicrobium sp.]
MNKEKELYPPATPEMSKKRADLAPKTTAAFRNFSKEVFKEGALDEKTKQLIAVAAAHVTQCPYCIQGHTKIAKRKGASKEELMEAIWIAAAGRASGAYQFAAIAVQEVEIIDGKLEIMDNGKELHPQNTPEMAKKKAGFAPVTAESWRTFSTAVFKTGAIDGKTKQLIALAVSHVTQCPYCIHGHTKIAKRKGASNEEIMEAIWVASEMRAGAAYAHAAIAIEEMNIAENKNN